MSKGFGFDINKVMKQAQKMQSDVKRVQDELAGATVEATSGGGMAGYRSTRSGDGSSISSPAGSIRDSFLELGRSRRRWRRWSDVRG